MAEYRTPKINLGTNEDGDDWFGPAESLPYPIIEITDTEYVYQAPDDPSPSQGIAVTPSPG